MTENSSFFVREGEAYRPTAASSGYWQANSLHGRVLVGLLGYAIERDHGAPDMQPARLTVDMYRLPDLSLITVTTRVVRGGRRIKVIEAEAFCAGVSVARASCQLLLRTGAPDGKVWSPPNWDAPLPADIPLTDVPPMRTWKHRSIVGEVGTVGPRRIWMAERHALIEGEPLTPFTRVALAADFTSPWSNGGDQGVKYINSDVTIYLHRNPSTEWIGMEVINHGATAGVAIGQCFLYDEQGQIGSSSVAALVQARKT